MLRKIGQCGCGILSLFMLITILTPICGDSLVEATYDIKAEVPNQLKTWDWNIWFIELAHLRRVYKNNLDRNLDDYAKGRLEMHLEVGKTVAYLQEIYGSPLWSN